MSLGGTSETTDCKLIVECIRRGCSLCCTGGGVGRGRKGDNRDGREVTFEADVYDSSRDRVEHATSSFPRVASRRTQGNSHTMNTNGRTGVKDGSRPDVHNAMARPAGLREG